MLSYGILVHVEKNSAIVLICTLNCDTTTSMSDCDRHLFVPVYILTVLCISDKGELML